ncbi:ribose transport system permease protein RbsC [Gluconacetobacter diazotrophicus PA1 5]|uniref:Ribose ABC transporter permease n=1 Tax=Gluconacetobacter diazotrophicus TaxID=33996 RepID=A0A7W4I738_GLUDI|nr:ribose ABC transporter permease [Gluconacetobacter diazotrophicus]ACI50645.1 ribose transport system permease protein RbsC [Gluconacetobacter diazotrophicus PA1 5]MBB2157487.1 ribose ABC transporter permease [Gluconacetobacter diazotrophicus]TWB09477.1 monosaccharide ABC transporter membrane protein (CUT2 family) [Gluconacetobacter diazotrophicus]
MPGWYRPVPDRLRRPAEDRCFIYAIGSNEEAVRLSGIDARRCKIIVYLISGFTAALSGVVPRSRLMSGQTNADAITLLTIFISRRRRAGKERWTGLPAWRAEWGSL